MDYYRFPPTYLLPWDSLPITSSSEEVGHVIEGTTHVVLLMICRLSRLNYVEMYCVIDVHNIVTNLLCL